MSDYERTIVLERCCYTSAQHLRRRDFRDVVGRVHCRTGREPGVAILKQKVQQMIYQSVPLEVAIWNCRISLFIMQMSYSVEEAVRPLR